MKKILFLILPAFLLTNSYAFPSGKYECDFELFTVTYILTSLRGQSATINFYLL